MKEMNLVTRKTKTNKSKRVTRLVSAFLYPSPIFSIFLLFPVERYNPQENRWHTVSPMGTRRKHLGCAVYQDMIYSVGGRDDTTELSSAERYNPRTNQWSPVVAMTSRRSGVSLCVSQNKTTPHFT